MAALPRIALLVKSSSSKWSLPASLSGLSGGLLVCLTGKWVARRGKAGVLKTSFSAVFAGLLSVELGGEEGIWVWLMV